MESHAATRWATTDATTACVATRTDALVFGYIAALVLGLALGLLTSVAGAVSTGIVGNSGKQGANCVDCHDGGTVPAVRLEGPQRVYAEALATFRFVVQSQSARQQLAGFNVAASSGGLEPLRGDGAHLEAGELTHDAPKPANASESAWTFTWRAPAAAGNETIFAAGLSANGTGTRSGDESALLELDVSVDDGPRPGDADCDGALSAADIVALVDLLPASAAGECDLADADCDGAVDERDLAVLNAALFDSPAVTGCEPSPP
jgi:hypothetical protein